MQGPRPAAIIFEIQSPPCVIRGETLEQGFEEMRKLVSGLVNAGSGVILADVIVSDPDDIPQVTQWLADLRRAYPPKITASLRTEET